MSDATPLAQRIQAEFQARAERQKTVEQQRTQEAQDREKGLAAFGKICDDLKSVWGPRLEEFAKQFGDKIKMTPSVSPSQREAKVAFLTSMASMDLTFRVAPSSDWAKIVLDYDLLIVPIFFEYERNARLEMPFDKVDKDAVAKWLDDRLVSCVKAYLSMQDNQLYIQRAMVEDPITKAKFLPEDAKAKLDHGGKTLYFSSEDSLRQYKEKLQIDQPVAAPNTAGEPAVGAKPPSGQPVAGSKPAVDQPAAAPKPTPGVAAAPVPTNPGAVGKPAVQR